MPMLFVRLNLVLTLQPGAMRFVLFFFSLLPNNEIGNDADWTKAILSGLEGDLNDENVFYFLRN